MKFIFLLLIATLIGCGSDKTEDPPFCETTTCKTYQFCDETTKSCQLKEGRCDQNSDCSDRTDGKTRCNSDHTCVAEMIDPCKGVVCSGHGTCGAQGSTAICVCDEGYTVQELNCILNDPCATITCQEHASCSDGSCLCDEGYVAKGDQCVLPDPCATITCQKHASCSDGSCSCNEGFHPEGELCVIDQTDPCDGVVCDSGLTCVNGSCIAETTPLTIATYNLHDLTYSDAYNGVARVIKNNNIDIALFQEIQPEDEAPLKQALAAAGVDMPYIIYSSRGGYGGDDGDDYIACFSSMPITDYSTILGGGYTDPVSGEWFSMSYLRPVLKIEVTPNNKPVTLYNIHLKSHYPFPNCPDCLKQRRAQAHALERYIIDQHNPEQELIVIAGDVNSAIDTDFEAGETIDMLSLKSDINEANDFIPANISLLPSNAWTHNSYNSRLDHIFLSPALFQYYREASIKTSGSSYPYPSDHRSVILTVDIP